MISQPRPVGPQGWSRKFLIGLIPGVLCFTLIVVGSTLYVSHEQAARDGLQSQVDNLPRVAERADAFSVIDSATSAVNAATMQHNLAVRSVNLLARIARRLPSDVRFVKYTPDQSSVELEGPSESELGASTDALVSSATLWLVNPTNEFSTKTMYPTANLTWGTPAPSMPPSTPTPVPTTESDDSAGASPTPSPGPGAQPQ